MEPNGLVILSHRDQHCRWPGCPDPIDEVHHLHHWAAGGATDSDNLPGFCGTHHPLAHHPDWLVSGHANATIAFTHLPTGRTSSSAPPPPPPLQDAIGRMPGRDR